MSKSDDGGPAFPSHFVAQHMSGMSLRDWFAGQVANGILAADPLPDCDEHPHVSKADVKLDRKIFAGNCYGMADAMLVERKKGKP